MTTESPPARLVRIRDVCHRTGMSKAQVYKWARQGLFPTSVALGERSVAWLESEVQAWIDSRIETARRRLQH